MTTHSSFFEVMTNMHKFPHYIVFLAKKSIFKYPFISMFMSVTGHIPIDRRNKEESIRSINLAAEEIKRNNSSIGIYPEGTRRRRKSIGHPS
jgi:1-acyl-sn-glycerol-3-phosphate acyltransferase